MLGEEAVDGGLKIDDGVKDAVTEPAAGQGCEESLDGVEPESGGRREMESPAWVAIEPGSHLFVLVGRHSCRGSRGPVARPVCRAPGR